MTDRDRRIAEARAALQAAAEAGIDVDALRRFVASTTAAERVARADTSEDGLAAAEEAAYLEHWAAYDSTLESLLDAPVAAPGRSEEDNASLAVREVEAHRREKRGEGTSAVSIDPEMHSGDPVVAGTRIPVSTLVELRADGAPDEEILSGYPSLTKESLAAALRWAEEHGEGTREDEP